MAHSFHSTGRAQDSTLVAYLTPEEVLLQDQVQYYGSDGTPLPINPRRARMIVESQYQSSRSSSSASSQSSSTSSVAGNPYLLPQELDLRLEGDILAPQETIEPDPQVLRLLERLQNRENATVASVAQPEPRRPLVPSGPEAIASVLAMLLAVAATIVWARRTRGWHRQAW